MRRRFLILGEAGVLLGLAMALGARVPPAGAQQLRPEDAALMVLHSARRAYNERKYDFAAARFREFLQRYGSHGEAASAHYGLALSLLEGPRKDYAGAISALQQAVGRGNLPDRAFALHYLGAALRETGRQALTVAAAKPNEAAQHRKMATQRFTEAAKNFQAAAAAFDQRRKTPPAPPGKSADAEWAARAHCDYGEMLLRINRSDEAAKGAKAFLADPALAKGQYRELALYHLGYANFALKNYLAAGRALSRLAPFRQEFGVHARYLLARTHHLAGERPEAAAQYEAVLAGYEEQKKAAQAALRNPQALRPARRASLEALVRNPPPEYIPRASFYAALVLCEQGRFGNALERLTKLIQQYPKFPLVAEARLRVGFCQMESRSFPAAVQSLQPLCTHPRLGDRAMWWLARSQVGGANPANAQAYTQALTAAMGRLRQAADLAGRLAQSDPEAKVRRGDILLELADTQQLAKQFKEAAATYQQVISEKNNPDRVEEAMQRQATALHLAGQYPESDALCRKFEATYPKSTLMPAVWFRASENAYMIAMAAAKAPNLQNRERELSRLFGEAIRRYQRVVTQFPEFPYANLARQGMGGAYYQLGRYAEAIAVLGSIPQADRAGDLAGVSYLLADCHLRTLPAETDDAIQAARLIQRAGQAAKLLEGFVAMDPKGPQAPEALLRLGYCYQRIAGASAGPEDRKKQLSLARVVYERMQREFPKDPLLPTATFERAKCLAMLGDVNSAINELRRFQGDPLRGLPVAPLALLRLSPLLRGMNRAAEAVTMLQACRAQHEAGLLQDPARRHLAAMLQYEHALAVKQSGKPAEAKTMFDALAKQFPSLTEASNAVWRGAQCRREELMASLALARKTAANPGAKPDQIAAANNAIQQGLADLRKVLQSLQARAGTLGRKARLRQGEAPLRRGEARGFEPHLRMLYEAAWCHRVLADGEILAAREELRQEALRKLRAKLGSRTPPVRIPPALRAPEVPLSAVPVQPSETAARYQYRRLIAVAPEAPLAAQARLELAEMHAQREDTAAAADLLREALQKGPPPELAKRIRLRLAAACLAAGDAKAALGHVQAVRKGAPALVAAEARYLAGEARFQQRDWAKAIDLLLPFRDQGPFQNLRGLSDRALLRLGQAYAQTGQWDASRRTLETLRQRFRQSPWYDQALYGIGWAWQSQKQYDRAVGSYSELTRRTLAEVAAKAQLQIGLCRLAQKRCPDAARELLVVAFTYDYPKWQAAARCEAAKAYKEMKQPAEAERLWRRVLKDHPASRWAEVARQGLKGIR